MNRNLGALANDNSTTDKILASYGLYYQWGRKDPFIGPNTYQGSEGSGASMYSGSGSRVYLKMSESSAETGTMEYAIRNPLVFITGVADTDNDWLWSGRSDQLWSADDNVADKSVNDPCPYGWRVAPSGAFDNLAIVGTPAVGDEAKYGWTLTDGNAESFFIGAGRRRYDNGKILNIYNPLPISNRCPRCVPTPWRRNPGKAFTGRPPCPARRLRHSISGSRNSTPRPASKIRCPMPAPTAFRCVV